MTMLYSLFGVAALVVLLQTSDATSTQTRVLAARGSIAALNNLVVIGNPTAQDLSFSYYTYQVTSNAIAVDDYDQAKAGTAANTLITLATGDIAKTNDKKGTAFTGFGHAVAIADANTVFVSQSSKASNTGRVVVYEGNVTSFTGTQLLIPYDGKHRQDSDHFFGESIAAKHGKFAAGCQGCNTTAPMYSGAVYVYKPNPGGRWSETQVLTADGILFLGGNVAMHDRVLIATGDDQKLLQGYLHHVEKVANSVVVFEEDPHGNYQQRQVLQSSSGATKEGISSVTVFDETIAMATIGSDTSLTSGTAADKVYIFYPQNKRYGLEKQGKPGPQQWTNIQILTSAANRRYILGNSMVSISHNTLKYLSLMAGDNNAMATTTRSCLGCKFADPTLADLGITVAHTLLTADHNNFYSIATAGTSPYVIDEPVKNTFESGCLILSLQDQYNDGWGIANLVVERPDGGKDKFTLQCTTANPNIFKYCPVTQEDGKYSFYVEKGEETPFGWEIVWKVAANGVWYYGDRHTRMDFLWDTKYNDFHIGASHGVLPLLDTCKICSATKPEGKGKARRLSNLRSLHHKGKTSSPTVTAAPTIYASGQGTDFWNQIRMKSGDTTVWFESSYNGAYFWVSDSKGKKLLHTGTSCSDVSTTNKLCWVDLPDGDYTLRVGASVNSGFRATKLTYTFCHASNFQAADTELSFTVQDGECYAGTSVPASNKCTGTYKSAFFLKIGIVLGGGASSLSASDESSMMIAVTDTLQSVIGAVPSSTKVATEKVTSNGLEVTVLVKLDSVSDTTALDNFVRDTSSASSLLKYELIGSKTLSANFLNNEVSAVTITSVETATDEFDYTSIDESNFQTVTDHVWKTQSKEQSSSADTFNSYAEYVAEGAYAVVAVAAVLAVSLFVKRAMAKTTDETDTTVVKEVDSTVKPTFTVADIDEVEAGSEDSELEEVEAPVVQQQPKKQPKRVVLSTLPKRNIDAAGLKSLVDDDDVAFKAFKNKGSSRK